MDVTTSVNALIRASGIAASEARILLASASGSTRERLITWKEGFDGDVVERYQSLCARRAAGEPIAYLTGEREFYGRVFLVTPEVLIPRPETELLVERGLERAADAARVLDLGTGSGVVAVSLACENPTLRMVATDVSTRALGVARENARRLEAHIDFFASDWFSAFGAIGDSAGECADERAGYLFDLIVSNPPYIAAADPHLNRGDLRFEPRVAQTGGADGLSAIRAIIRGCPAHLNPGGWLLLEHGYDQASAVHALLSEAGFTGIERSRDLAGIGRVSAGRR